MLITPAVFDRKDLATHLGISVPTLRRWESEGIAPPHFKIKGKVYFRRAHVWRWLDARAGEVEPLELAN